MKCIKSAIIFILLSLSMYVNASNKVFFLHGYAGPGFEMKKILKAVEVAGYDCTLFKYKSFVDDVDSDCIDLIKKIQSEKIDTISFVTHSMGALVVRAIYSHLDSLPDFPVIQRIVMIAPANNGTPVADFYAKVRFLRPFLGPNIHNLTTNPVTGAGRYPIPTCEVGLIAGSFSGSKVLNIFTNKDNDGLIVLDQTRLGIEKDTVFLNAWHFGILYDKKVIRYVISFLKYGKFT